MRRSRAGGSAVEFALILPVLIILLGGVLEWSMFARQQMDMLHAVREGARTGVGVELEDDEGVSVIHAAAEERTLAALAERGVTTATTVNTEISDLLDREVLTVTAVARYDAMIAIIPMPTTTTGTATMMLEETL